MVGHHAGMAGYGSSDHRRLIDQVIAHYRHDDRVRAVVVFGSVSTGAWHELSDVDLDTVTADGARVQPAGEIAALFGERAAVVLAGEDSADVVLDSLEEVSIRWHPLSATSPNIIATAQVVAGDLRDSELAAAGNANRAAPDAQRRLDAVVREAIGARKALARGRRWEAVAAVERVRGSLTRLRGRRDGLRLDPADPATALDILLAEIAREHDFGPGRRALLEQAQRLAS